MNAERNERNLALIRNSMVVIKNKRIPIKAHFLKSCNTKAQLTMETKPKDSWLLSHCERGSENYLPKQAFKTKHIKRIKLKSQRPKSHSSASSAQNEAIPRFNVPQTSSPPSRLQEENSAETLLT